MRPILFLLLFSLFSLTTVAGTRIVTNTNNTGIGSLRAEIDSAQSGDTIRFSPTLIASGSSSIVLTSRIIFNKSVTIKGIYNSTDTLFISGGGIRQPFKIDSAGTIYLDSIAMVDGKVNGAWGNKGGAIVVLKADSLVITNSIFRNNIASYGGAVYLGTGRLLVSNSIFKGNRAYQQGGAIFYGNNFGSSLLMKTTTLIGNRGNQGGSIYAASDLDINNSLISANTANIGGGIYCHQSHVYFRHSIARHNSSTNEDGGGIYTYLGEVSAYHSTIANNTSNEEGGGIFSYNVNLYHSKVSNNTARFGGGGISLSNKLVVNNSRISTNSSSKDGGGVYFSSTRFEALIDSSRIDHNSASLKGGGMYLYGSSGSLSQEKLELKNSVVDSNSALRQGGGISCETYFSAYTYLVIENSSISVNSSNSTGGGIYSYSSISPSTVLVDESTFNHNTSYYGGGLAAPGGIINASHSTFSNNKANTTAAGGIIAKNALIKNCTIYQNKASTGGSGIYVTNSLTLEGSIVVNPDTVSNMVFTSFTSNGYNLVSDSTLAGSHSSDSLGVDSAQLKLGPLVNNGGTTLTHVPLSGSIAINNGNPLDVSAAQNRLLFGIRDRGAAENNCNSYSWNTVTACNAYTWAFDGVNYSRDTLIQDTLFGVNVNGCDSIGYLNLSINKSTSSTITVSNCGSNYTSPSGKIYATSGIYKDTISNHSGCDSIITLTLSFNSSSLFTDSVQACFSYTWATNGQTYLSDTIVHDTLFGGNVNGCDSIITMKITITTLDTSVSIIYPHLKANQDSVSYQWLDCNASYSPITANTSQWFSIPANGSYAVELTKNGCVDTSRCMVITTVGLDQLNAIFNSTVYPNPTSGNLIIKLGTLSEVGISLYTSTGKLVKHYNKVSGSNFNLNLTDYEEGVYILKIHRGEFVRSMRIVKIK